MSLFRSTRPAPRARKATPRLEALGDRTVPAVTGWSFDSAGVLHITCDNQSDVLQILEVGASNGRPAGIRVIDTNGGVKTFDRRFDLPTSVIVDAGGGNDQVTYRLSQNTPSTWSRDLQVNLGAGNDTFTGTLAGAQNGPGGLRMIVRGEDGADTIRTTMTRDVLGGQLGLSFSGGAGDDRILVDFDNGGAGNLSDVDIASGATVWMNLWGGDGNDLIDVDYRGELDGRLLLHVEGDAGIDRIYVDVIADAGSFGRVGDGGPQSADPQTEWNRVSRVMGEDGNDRLHFNIVRPTTLFVCAEVWGGYGVDTFSGNVPVQDIGVI